MNKEELYGEIADLFSQLSECFKALQTFEVTETEEDDIDDNGYTSE